VGRKAPTLEPASHQCWGKGYDHRICKFYNLLLWNDTFYYVTSEESVLEAGLPDIPMSWVHIPFAEKMRFSEGGMARMVSPERLPFNFSTTPALEMQDAVVWHLTYHDNFGHLLGEHGPTLHNALCTYMGKCTFSGKDRDIHILLPHNEDDMMAVMPTAAREMFHCFTKHPMRQTDELFFKDRVVVIRTALFGIGPTCRGFPWCRPNYGRGPIPGVQVVKWRTRIMRCLDLPTRARVFPRHPNLVIVDRPLVVGRGFLNRQQIVQRLAESFPNLPISVQVLDGMPLARQAAVYSNASIVIQAHGAALGHMVFLPKGASIIDISPLNHEDKPAWTFYMASDFGVLAFNPIRIPQQRPLPMLHKLKAYKQWHQLTPEWRQRILEEGICPRDDQIDDQFSTNIWCKFYWILKHSNMVVDLPQITTAVNAALLHLKSLESKPAQYYDSLSHSYTAG